MATDAKVVFELGTKINNLINSQAVFFHTERVMGKQIAEKRKFEFLSALMDIVHPKDSECKEGCTCHE
jgi:hypothetical protein